MIGCCFLLQKEIDVNSLIDYKNAANLLHSALDQAESSSKDNKVLVNAKAMVTIFEDIKLILNSKLFNLVFLCCFAGLKNPDTVKNKYDSLDEEFKFSEHKGANSSQSIDNIAFMLKFTAVLLSETDELNKFKKNLGSAEKLAGIILSITIVAFFGTLFASVATTASFFSLLSLIAISCIVLSCLDNLDRKYSAICSNINHVKEFQQKTSDADNNLAIKSTLFFKETVDTLSDLDKNTSINGALIKT
jgi:hypothetical protein